MRRKDRERLWDDIKENKMKGELRVVGRIEVVRGQKTDGNFLFSTNSRVLHAIGFMVCDFDGSASRDCARKYSVSPGCRSINDIYCLELSTDRTLRIGVPHFFKTAFDGSE